ncbi:MAG TPA: xanthine dehydrogenase family protein molybdopterin-binding subunit [Candidatus Eremiobacteraceae bacterium]|nr:xanthine dehydrogenase family protein molybdopterin-binding subunit [Candidatus Eremiobacteraceae bacterium]
MTGASPVIGTAHTRNDAPAKVAGTAVYTADVVLEAALAGVVLRSPHAFARIKNIDVSRAVAMPGVRAVIFSGNVPSKPLDFGIKDQHLFPVDCARYKGEPVAAVAADTEGAARAAAQAIDVAYEPLNPVSSIEEALAPNATLVHPQWRTYERSEDRVLHDNVCGYNRVRRGDVDGALARAAKVVTSNFTFSAGLPGYLEPRAAAAHAKPDGSLTVWCGSQAPYSNRDELAEFFGLDRSKVRFINQYVGGAFGGKILMAAEWFAAALALQCDRPVRMAWTRHEDNLHAFPRHGGRATLTSGAASDGTLLAMRASFTFDTGAYLGYGTGGSLIATMLASAPYRIPNLDLDATIVYTNKHIAGPVRAPGGPQANFAKELHLDELARALRIDPLEFRLKNAWVDGDVSPSGQRLTAVSARDVLQKAADAVGWGKPLPDGRGRGIGATWWFSTCGGSEARVHVRTDGSVRVVSGNPEIGTGSASQALPIIVADALGIDPSTIELDLADTGDDANDSGVHGSTSTFSAGQAVGAAAADARAQLLDRAESLLEARRDDLELRDGCVFVAGAPQSKATFAELTAHGKTPVEGRGSAPELGDPEIDDALVQSHGFAAWPAASYTATAAEVDVDHETGRVEVLHLATAQDVGFAFNPAGVIGQIEGGAVQGLGWALTEGLRYEGAELHDPDFKHYLLPTAVDAPRITALIVECPSVEGPRGMKGAGEPPVTTPPAAIGNAIRDACGAVPNHTPMTPECVWRAIREHS